MVVVMAEKMGGERRQTGQGWCAAVNVGFFPSLVGGAFSPVQRNMVFFFSAVSLQHIHPASHQPPITPPTIKYTCPPPKSSAHPIHNPLFKRLLETFLEFGLGRGRVFLGFPKQILHTHIWPGINTYGIMHGPNSRPQTFARTR